GSLSFMQSVYRGMHRAQASIHGSIVAGLFPDQNLTPSGTQHVAPFGISLAEIIRLDDAVGAEAAEVVAQLAPRREQPHRFEIADGDRPDRTLAVATLLIAIAQCDLPAFVNLRARPRHVDAIRFFLPDRPRAARRLQHEGAQPFRNGVGD